MTGAASAGSAAAAAPVAVAELARVSPAFPRDADGPVFRAPWEAQAFAMALALHERGTFTWTEWAATLAAVIAEAQAQGDPDTGENYYRHWLGALERLVTAKGLVTAGLLTERRGEWEEAARRTPHGQPIALCPRTARDDHREHRTPEGQQPG